MKPFSWFKPFLPCCYCQCCGSCQYTAAYRFYKRFYSSCETCLTCPSSGHLWDTSKYLAPTEYFKMNRVYVFRHFISSLLHYLAAKIQPRDNR